MTYGLDGHKETRNERNQDAGDKSTEQDQEDSAEDLYSLCIQLDQVYYAS